MNHSHGPADDPFDRLQRLLLTLQHGDAVVVREIVRLTGMAESTCLAVLEGLARAGLMAREGEDRFVRVLAP
jgi:DNA-binding IclR family transcriptional regulator